MQNYALLEVVGKLGKPVLLKRGLSSTLDELLLAADYVLKEGNERRDPLRARHPHVRDRHALHARPRRRAVAEAAHAPAGDRRPVARRGRPAPGRAARRARRPRSARTGSSSRSPRIPRPRSATARSSSTRATSASSRSRWPRTPRSWASGWLRIGAMTDAAELVDAIGKAGGSLSRPSRRPREGRRSDGHVHAVRQRAAADARRALRRASRHA